MVYTDDKEYQHKALQVPYNLGLGYIVQNKEVLASSRVDYYEGLLENHIIHSDKIQTDHQEGLLGME
jgi:hypothetical protein